MIQCSLGAPVGHNIKSHHPLELNAFIGSHVPIADSPSHSTTGLSMVTYLVDVEATLGRLADLGLGGTPHRVTQRAATGDITIALVRDPDGVRVLLTPGSITH